jgi:ferredoxin-type protein NapH
MSVFTATRKTVQYIILAGIFIVPVLNLFEIYFIKGSFISIEIGSLDVADPVMILQTVFTGNLALPLVASAALPVLMAALFGRLWCSFFCPYTTIMELLEKIPFLRRKLFRKKARKNSENIRNILFLAMLFTVGVAGLPLLNLISPSAVLSVQAILIIKRIPTVEILFIALAIGLEFVSLRLVCRYICPTGICLSFFQNRRSLRPVHSGSCLNCGKCSIICPMGVNPTADLPSSFCHNCGKCIEICADKTKPLRWKR